MARALAVDPLLDLHALMQEAEAMALWSAEICALLPPIMPLIANVLALLHLHRHFAVI